MIDVGQTHPAGPRFTSPLLLPCVQMGIVHLRRDFTLDVRTGDSGHQMKPQIDSRRHSPCRDHVTVIDDPLRADHATQFGEVLPRRWMRSGDVIGQESCSTEQQRSCANGRFDWRVTRGAQP